MTRLRWIVAGLGAVILLAFVGFQIFKRPIAEAAFQRAIAENLGRDRASELPDGLHVYLCGAGSPMPDALRGGPCVGVVAGDRLLIFDAGSGGSRVLGRMGFPAGRIDRVYLTHLHSDHIDGLGELLLQAWIGGSRTAPLPVWGPVGTSEVVDGFNAAYRIDSTYRVAHHGPGIAPPNGFGAEAREFRVPAGPAGSLVVLDEGDVRVTAVNVSHAPIEPAFGYRVDYKDRSISISGDTIYDARFVSLSDGVDLMFHEALQPEMVAAMSEAAGARGADNFETILADILDYHASPQDAARAADEAGAERLVLYHIVPPLPARLLEPVFLDGVSDNYRGPVDLGEDGLLFSLPAGSDNVRVENLLR